MDHNSTDSSEKIACVNELPSDASKSPTLVCVWLLGLAGIPRESWQGGGSEQPILTP